ncbi:hypothetical protein QQ045_016535 [Rhodiola kirilowii]
MPPKSLLHQLLQEDQEPFHLRDYIADRRTKLRTSTNQLQLTRVKKPLCDTSEKSSSRSSSHFPVTFCKNACFDAKNDSPDLTKPSPVFNFPRSPVKMLHIPSKTAALLLEAALRIHKQRKNTQRYGTDLGFFGSVLKKLTVKTQKRNNHGLQSNTVSSQKKLFRRDMSGKSASGSEKLKHDSSNLVDAFSDSDLDFCCNGRRSDAVWSEDKSLDTETSCSSSNSDVTQFVEEQTESPLRRRSPDFSLHPSSPSRHSVKDGDEEGKEQCSPVCVLDPLFEDDDGANEEYETDHDGYAGKKEQLLQRASRFEALADLDPKELEQLIVEDELNYNLPEFDMLEEDDDFDPADEFLQRVLEKCGFHDPHRISNDVKKLVSDLIAEVAMNDHEVCGDTNGVANTVCAKLESWKEVEANTIDMMVEQDFKLESRRWTLNQEHGTMVATEIELDIYGSLVREVLSEFGNPLDC